MPRILVIEDEPSIAGIILFKLSREGHSVRWETEPAAALAAVRAAAPDLILLDVGSGPVGLDLLRRLGRERRVVALTELGDAEGPLRALAAGACAALPKPFKPTLLARLVGELIA